MNKYPKNLFIMFIITLVVAGKAQQEAKVYPIARAAQALGTIVHTEKKPVGKKQKYYKGLKPPYPVLRPKKIAKNPCDPANNPYVYNAIDKVIASNQERIAAVALYGAHMLENIRGRDMQGNLCRKYPGQDRILATSLLGKTMFALCDGHGVYGDTIAEQVLKTVSLKVLNSTKTGEGFITACKAMQDALTKNNQAFRSGTTFVAAVIQDKKLTVAHVGDSRLLVIRPQSSSLLHATTDHKQTDKRSGLALSRALGDVEVHQLGYVTAQPDIAHLDLVEGDYIVIASDGYWDVFNNTKTVEYVLSAITAKKDCKLMAKELTEAARDAGSRDDISVLVVKFTNSAT